MLFFVMDTNVIFGYSFVAPLTSSELCKVHTKYWNNTLILDFIDQYERKNKLLMLS